MENDTDPLANRELGGRLVRETWIKWAQEQPNPKPSWLVPWEELSEPDKEVDRRIWEACVQPQRDNAKYLIERVIELFAGNQRAAKDSALPSKARYALLAGATYYPPPGWTAFIESSDDMESLIATGKQKADDLYGWWQIVDTHTSQIVAGEGKGHTGLLGHCQANPNAA